MVTRSIPRGAIVAGVPASILCFRTERDRFSENRSGGSKARPEWMAPPDPGPGSRGNVYEPLESPTL